MSEEIYKEFEQKRAETLKQPEFKERGLTKEKEKDILREIVSEHIGKTQSYSDVQSFAAQRVKQIKPEPKEKQIELLSELAFEKGIPHAIEVAKRLDNPYILDEFHDALIDNLYSKLIENGKLKEL